MKTIEEIKNNFTGYQFSYNGYTEWWKKPVVMVETRKKLSPMKIHDISYEYYILENFRYDDTCIFDLYRPVDSKIDAVFMSLQRFKHEDEHKLEVNNVRFYNSTLKTAAATDLLRLHQSLCELSNIICERDDFPGYDIGDFEESTAKEGNTYADIKIVKYYNRFEDLEKIAVCFNPIHHLHHIANKKGDNRFEEEFIAEYDYPAREFKQVCLNFLDNAKFCIEELKTI